MQLDGNELYDQGVDPVAVRRVVGMVFQRPNPFLWMSIYDNVAAGLRLNGVKNKKILDEAVERSLMSANPGNEVKDRLGKAGIGLSGGQQQRLCIARHRCGASGDPDGRAMLGARSDLHAGHRGPDRGAPRAVHRGDRHPQHAAARVSDQTAFFNLAAQGKPGKLIEIGSTEKIFSNLDQKATEDYITGRSG